MAREVLDIRRRICLKDEEYLFFKDSFDKKNIARSSHNKRTHTGKGGCCLPSDKMTKKELHAMNGEVKSYRMNDPITWAEFKTWPDEHKASYIKILRQKWNAPDTAIAEMIGISDRYFIKSTLEPLNLQRGRGAKRKWDSDGFWRWAKGVPAEAAEEAASEQTETAEQAEALEFVPELGICEPDSGLEALEAAMEEDEQTEQNVPMPEPVFIITMKEKTLLERAVGMLEGLSYGAQQCICEGIMDAVQMLDSVLNKPQPVEV